MKCNPNSDAIKPSNSGNKQTLTRQEIAVAEDSITGKEIKYLEGQDFAVRKARITEIKATINEYLDYERLIGSSVMDGIITHLFDCDYDIESKLWDLENDSIDFIKALADPKVTKLLGQDTAKKIVDMLFNINRFASSIDDFRMAELKLAFLEYDGEGHMRNSLYVEKEYLLKLKTRKLQIEMLNQPN